MLARALKKTPTESSFEYNEKKEKQGVAQIIATNALPLRRDLYLPYFSYIEETFQNGHTKNTGFHMTLSPGMNESLTDEAAIKLISKIMDDLDMGKQPYVIFKHNDTGHEHYHIVSTLIERTESEHSRIIDQHNNYNRILESLRKHEEEFGYKTGKDPNFHEEFIRPKRFDINRGNTRKQIASLVEESLGYSYENREEFEAILRTKNVLATKKKNSEEYSFTGLTSLGNKNTQPQNNAARKEIYEEVEQKASPFFREYNQDYKKNTMDLVERALYLTNTKKAFLEYLRGNNIMVSLKESKKGGYEEIFYVDNNLKAVFRHSEFEDGLSLAKFNAIIAMRWNSEKSRKEEEEERQRRLQKKNVTQKTKNIKH